MHESAGNPSAVNGWDSNAAKGTPSIGLLQVIQPTFNAYQLAGHGNIYNPVDNIIAGARYAARPTVLWTTWSHSVAVAPAGSATKPAGAIPDQPLSLTVAGHLLSAL